MKQIILAQSAPAGGGNSQTPEPVGFGNMLVPIILMMIIFYFVMIRPQRLRQKKHDERLSKIKKGEKIITTGGIHGVIHAIRDRTVVLHVGNNLNIEVEKGCIQHVIEKEIAKKSAPSTNAK